MISKIVAHVEILNFSIFAQLFEYIFVEILQKKITEFLIISMSRTAEQYKHQQNVTEVGPAWKQRLEDQGRALRSDVKP